MKIQIFIIICLLIILITGCNTQIIQDKELCGDCPHYSQPAPGWCNNGTIISGEVDECGCQENPICI